MDKTLPACYNLTKIYEGEDPFMPFPSLLPKMILPRLTDLSPKMLEEKGIRLLMLDFDNTIVPYTTDLPTRKMAAWIRKMQASPIRLCVVSNSKRDRVKKFCRQYGLDCITGARKPFSKGIRECLMRYGMEPKDAALVGDQIYTDTLGANAAGVTSILVNAINNHNLLLKARHLLELPFIFAGRKRRVKL